MVINIRGTSGSGKSYVMRKVLAGLPDARPIHGALGPKRPEAYFRAGSKPVAIIGPYGTEIGGCDVVVGSLGIQGCIELFKKYHDRGASVLFEGLILSSMWGAVGEWMESVKRECVIVHLSTSLEDCRRGLDRRQAVQRAVKTQAFHFQGTVRVVTAAAEKGFRVERFSSDQAISTVLGWL